MSVARGTQPRRRLGRGWILLAVAVAIVAVIIIAVMSQREEPATGSGAPQATAETLSPEERQAQEAARAEAEQRRAEERARKEAELRQLAEGQTGTQAKLAVILEDYCRNSPYRNSPDGFYQSTPHERVYVETWNPEPGGWDMSLYRAAGTICRSSVPAEFRPEYQPPPRPVG